MSNIINLDDYQQHSNARQMSAEEIQLSRTPPVKFESIEIDADRTITVTYGEKTESTYTSSTTTSSTFSVEYLNDPELHKYLTKLWQMLQTRFPKLDKDVNYSCPPGCAECCKNYEPFVTEADVQRIADHKRIKYEEAMREYVNERPSIDGYNVGWLKKVGPGTRDACVFLKGDRSGREYCSIYEIRPEGCAAFTPVGCTDVNDDLWKRSTTQLARDLAQLPEGAGAPV